MCEIDAGAFVLKKQSHTWEPGSQIDQSQIQASPRYRMNHLGWIFAVRLKRKFAVWSMNHPPAHGNGILQDFLRQSDSPQCLNAADGESQVDGAAPFRPVDPRIRAFFIHVDF